MKLLKSKKGFTLVELMIVVVIMAILVAVAVPIYNAVTENARTKTCLGNQRTIISSINSSVMTTAGAAIDECKFTITTDDSAQGASFKVIGGELPDFFDLDDIKALFKTVPCCPIEGSVITVTIKSDNEGENSNVSTECSIVKHQNETFKK